MLRDPLAEDSFRRWGGWVMGSGLSAGLLLVAFLTYSSLTLLLAFGAFLLACVAGWILFRNPLLNLVTLLVGFLLIAGFEDGTQPTEVLYGLYYLAFMAHWFGTRLFLYRDRIFETRESRVLITFLVLASASVGLTLLFRGDLRFFIGEWLSLSFLSLYFPVKEAVTRHKHGLAVVMGAVLVVGLVISARNVFQYRQILVEAAYAWQVTRGRAVTNTAVITVPLFASLMYLLHARHLWRSWLPAGVFAVFFAGLIISQSRGYWLAFVVGAAFLLVFMAPTQRRRLVGLGVFSVVGVVGAGYLLLGDVFVLVASGMLDRVLSIGSATSQDLSLINRFRETSVVVAKTMENPILGYGMGVPFRFYDLTFLPPFTYVKSFLHNGYVALWYKFGIWGLGMVLWFWGSAIVNAVRVYRSKADLPLRLVCGAIAGILVCYSVSAITSNPFYINDPMFMFGIVTGVAAGARQSAGL